MELHSPAFVTGGGLPKRYTAAGEDVSPPLEWEDEPVGTKELVLFCTDADVRFYDVFVRWIVYDIPPGLGSLPEGLPHFHDVTKPRVLQGDNDTGEPGWGGPRDDGVHNLTFTLHALDRTLEVGGGAGRGTLLDLMEDHVLATAELEARYEP